MKYADDHDEFAILNRDFARTLGISDGDEVVISTRVGSVFIKATLSDQIHPDSVSVTHGWREANVSELTSGDNLDELTGMVVQTALPVTVRRK